MSRKSKSPKKSKTVKEKRKKIILANQPPPLAM